MAGYTIRTGWRGNGGAGSSKQQRKLRAACEGNLRPLGGRHGDGFLSFGELFKNGVVWWELRRERRKGRRMGSVRNLLCRSCLAVSEELQSGVFEQKNADAERYEQRYIGVHLQI
jgi:hypothetical protein